MTATLDNIPLVLTPGGVKIRGVPPPLSGDSNPRRAGIKFAQAFPGFARMILVQARKRGSELHRRRHLMPSQYGGDV